MDLDLWDADSFVLSDDKVSQGQITWDPSTSQSDEYKQTSVKGDYGEATVGYVAMANALQAVVQVIMISGSGESPADVYGKVRTLSRHVQRELFNKEWKENVMVQPGSAIPLSMAVIAVP